jgi:hypothetical protein
MLEKENKHVKNLPNERVGGYLLGMPSIITNQYNRAVDYAKSKRRVNFIKYYYNFNERGFAGAYRQPIYDYTNDKYYIKKITEGNNTPEVVTDTSEDNASTDVDIRKPEVTPNNLLTELDQNPKKSSSLENLANLKYVGRIKQIETVNFKPIMINNVNDIQDLLIIKMVNEITNETSYIYTIYNSDNPYLSRGGGKWEDKYYKIDVEKNMEGET